MSIARAIRLLLGFATLLVIIWSFIFVGARIYHERFGTHRPITLTILHWGDNSENHISQELVAHYEAAHPNVHIQDISASDYDPKLKTMFAAGTPPDVFYLSAERLTENASLGVIKPLDPFLAKEPNAKKWLADFYPILLDSFRYDGHHVGKGPLYGLPKDCTTCVMYVNVDVFHEAGIEVPYGGWTWDDYQADCRKITNLTRAEGRPIYGGVMETWPGVLRNVLWTFGAEFFSDDNRDTLLGSPAAQAALKMIRRLKFDDKTIFNATSGNQEQGGQEFFSGNIGIYGPIGRWKTPRLRSVKPKAGPDDANPAHFTWDVVPVPRGKEQASAIFTVAWAMSQSTKHPNESFELIKYLSGPQGQALNAKLGLAIPALKNVANSPAFLDGLPAHSQVFLDAFKYARLGQYPKQPEAYRIIEREAATCLQRGENSTEAFAATVLDEWHKVLDSPLQTHTYPPMPWKTIASIIGAILLFALMLLWWQIRREEIGAIDRRAERAGWLFISPWVIGFLVFTLGPMVLAAALALTRWTAMTPFTSAEFVGLDNFRHMAHYDESFFHSLWVTIYFVALAVPVSQVAALAVAVLMNTRARGIEVFRTIYFVPSVVSGVALAVLWLWIFNNQLGPLNKILAPVTHLFGLMPPDWLGRDAGVWAVPAFVIMGLWGVGGGMIIYLAGLKGIPASLYEAATLDGASPARQFWNVTLPMLSPLIFYQLVMSIIGSFQIFTQAKVMTPDGAGGATLFYVFNLYRQAFEFENMGYASAMAWILFLLLLALTIFIFRASKNLVYYEGLKT